ncbi:MAG: EAL domain-containing protein, partial [Ruminococcus sp.]|nr:EAL domain-containing protein [Ruminococcus sp.]
RLEEALNKDIHDKEELNIRHKEFFSKRENLNEEITKLDKSFTTMDENDKMALVVSHSIDLIKALKMKIVVEGVETKEMLARFSSLGCEYIQGYYFSKPLPRDEFVSYILEHIDN